MKPMTPVIARFCGALLLGGAVLVGSACAKKQKDINLYPEVRVAQNSAFNGAADQAAADAAAAAAAAAAAKAGPPKDVPAPAIDPATGGRTEAMPDPNSNPIGSQIPELAPVLFKFDDDKLTPDAEKVLASNAAFLKKSPQYSVVLRGHTDPHGTEEYNISLGSRRAQAVRERLIELGIDSKRLETISFGENVLLVEGTDDASNAKNRAVEFFVFTVEAPKATNKK